MDKVNGKWQIYWKWHIKLVDTGDFVRIMQKFSGFEKKLRKEGEF